MSKLKKPLIFSLVLLPFTVLGGIFTCLYQFDLYAEDILAEAIAQLGSKEVLMVISTIQVAGYSLICSFFGYILAEKTGILKVFSFEKKRLCKVLIVTVVAGILFSLDYWTFGKIIPEIGNSYTAGITVEAFIASVLYGGILEEIMLRLFFMSLIAFILWKIFDRKNEKASTGIVIAANVVAAIVFAAGHLPSTVLAFGEITPLILFRCFLLNGGFGLLFGWLYRKHGIQYSMVAHMGCHIVSKVIWILFI